MSLFYLSTYLNFVLCKYLKLKNMNMKSLFKSLIIVVALLLSINAKSQDKLFAYYKVTTSGTVQDVAAKLKAQLKTHEFMYLGAYHPEGKSNMYVIAFTKKQLYALAIYGKTHKALASVLKFGIIKKGNTVTVSLLNPEYIFYAYFRNTTGSYDKLKVISNETHEILKSVGSGFKGFGGQLSKNELKKYHYMMGMPYFTDPVELNEMPSFEKACETIEKNLNAGKGKTARVYRLKFNKSQIAIYGVALKDKEDGEASFLPVIGEDHIAAMPYELIVIGKKVMMLHGKYRLALHWPELSMGQFMKIVSTPGYIEDTMKALTK